MTLGQRITRLRRQREWTQDQFANLVGVHNRHVSRWERDKNRPSAGMLEKIAQVFEISLDDLTGANTRPPIEAILPDTELLQNFQEIQDLEEEDRATILRVIQAFVVKKRMEKVLKSA